MAKAHARHAAKAKHALRAMDQHPHAAMHHKAPPDLKAKVMAAAKVDAMAVVKAAVAKSNALTRVLTTGATAKAAQPLVVHVQKAVALPEVVKVVKTAATTIAMSCHDT